MRRFILPILLLLVIATPFVMRMALVPDAAGEASGGGKKGLPRLVVVTPHNQDIRREFARAFSKWHLEKYKTEVEIDYRTPGGTADIKRQLDATYRRYRDAAGKLPPQVPADIDVVWGGGDHFFYSELDGELGVLQPMDLDASLLHAAFPEAELVGVRLYDRPASGKEAGHKPKWVGVCLSAFGIVYNPEFYATLGLAPPRTWSDLTDPRLKDLLALADPAHSGSAGVAYMMVIQRAMADAERRFELSTIRVQSGVPREVRATQPKIDSSPAAYQKAISQGWHDGLAILTRMAANARYFTDSSPMVPRDVSHAEAAAGVAIDFYGRVEQESVGPERCRFVAPQAATAITPDPIGILYGVTGTRLELATHFVEFMLTPEGQRLWILKAGTEGGPRDRALRRPPVRRDLYADRTNWSDPDVNPFEEAGGFNQRGQWMALFTDSRMVWTAAWVDARESMKDAYAAILEVNDLRLRGDLLEQLGRLPIAMDDAGLPADHKDWPTVAGLRQQRGALEKGTTKGDVNEWKARTRLDLAARFRAHYDALREKAEAAR